MPFFNEASRIYNQIEVDFMRSCYAHAAIMLEESDRGYSARDLASLTLLLYDSGLRDHNYITELVARLANKKFMDRRQKSMAANSNLEGTNSSAGG
ncbi:hypothetical protein ACFSE0_19670 [Ochrobactrum teleogrylli]|uniref:Uncharacterized protein n=1 Tax=Ochrobactrum teleogrylli TaxID=2479765 RepID=A0ABY2XZX8_9HYPH|nr:hypothetical protein [[Ochrobactrum] teleogrylli]TNV11518.1 hypothetical protein FIC94_18555 [[Ochrobactrum] teleogrylli]